MVMARDGVDVNGVLPVAIEIGYAVFIFLYRVAAGGGKVRTVCHVQRASCDLVGGPDPGRIFIPVPSD